MAPSRLSGVGRGSPEGHVLALGQVSIFSRGQVQVSLCPRGCLESDTSGATHPADVSKENVRSYGISYC